MNIKNTDIAEHLKLPPVKLHCSMLAEDAIKAAVKDYKKKKGPESAADVPTTVWFGALIEARRNKACLSKYT